MSGIQDSQNIRFFSKNVVRIKKDNNIVWEKIDVELVASKNNPKYSETISLTATMRDSDGAPFDGIIDIEQKNGDSFSRIGGGQTSNGSFTMNYSCEAVQTDIFRAKFSKTVNRPTAYSNEISVTTNKDTPTITSLTGNIYSGWNIGAQIKDSFGKVISGIPIVISGSSSGTYNSNSSGKIQRSFTGTAGTSYTVKYTFNGNENYNACNTSKTFTINTLPTKVVCVGTVITGASTGSYREWNDTYTNCTDNACQCTNIATASGTYKRPALLTKNMTFSIPSGATVTNLKAYWKSSMLKYTSGSGYAKIGAPTITISGDGSGSSHSHTAGTPGHDSYVSGTFNYSGATTTGLNDGVKVTVNFPANTGGEIGKLSLIGPQLTATYRPKQGEL